MQDQLLEEQAKHEDAILRQIRDLEDFLGELRVSMQNNDDERIEKDLGDLVVLATPLHHVQRILAHASSALTARKLLAQCRVEKKEDLTVYVVSKGYNLKNILHPNFTAQDLKKYMQGLCNGAVIQVTQYSGQMDKGSGRYRRHFATGLFQVMYEDPAIGGLLQYLGLPEKQES